MIAGSWVIRTGDRAYVREQKLEGRREGEYLLLAGRTGVTVIGEEQRGLSKRSVEVLRLIAEGRSYEQILSLHPGLSYLDIFGAAREALEVAGGKDYADRIAEIRKAHPRAYEKWSTQEDMELTRLVAGGESVEEISARLQRQPDAIRARMMKLNLVENGIEG